MWPFAFEVSSDDDYACVFSGSATNEDDKPKLVLPIVGLYAELLASTMQVYGRRASVQRGAAALVSSLVAADAPFGVRNAEEPKLEQAPRKSNRGTTEVREARQKMFDVIQEHRDSMFPDRITVIEKTEKPRARLSRRMMDKVPSRISASRAEVTPEIEAREVPLFEGLFEQLEKLFNEEPMLAASIAQRFNRFEDVKSRRPANTKWAKANNIVAAARSLGVMAPPGLSLQPLQGTTGSLRS